MNKNIKAKSVKICCNECKHEFSANSVNIEEAVINLSGQALKLVYFTCPKCNKIYRITLKDEAYEKLKNDLECTKERMRKICDSGDQEFASTLSSMIEKKYKRLKNYSDKLNGKFPGTFTFVTSKNNNEEKIIKYLP